MSVIDAPRPRNVLCPDCYRVHFFQFDKIHPPPVDEAIQPDIEGKLSICITFRCDDPECHDLVTVFTSMNTSDDLRGDALALAKKLKVVSAGTTFKTAWKKLITAANLPGLRPYDMRHTGITNLLQLPEVSLETCKAIAGHISAEIVKTYSHIGMTARREALDALMRAATKRPPAPGSQQG